MLDEMPVKRTRKKMSAAKRWTIMLGLAASVLLFFFVFYETYYLTGILKY